MALRDLMQTFGARLCLGEIELDEDGGAQILLGDTLAVDVLADEQGQGFAMVATVSRLPADKRLPAYTEVLEANAAGLGTGGVCLGIDSDRQEIVLRRHIPTTDLPLELFDQELAAFAEELAFWRARCERGQLGTGEPATDAADASAAGQPVPGIRA
jgi:hypothetical protein